MRNAVTSLVVALVVLLTGLTPGASIPRAAAASSAKVVIVVGATHGVTETYRQRADVAYAEAIKHSSNVVKIYSPNATWPAVKAALQGASVVIYMGHGNGFPSPYRSTPWAYSQNGFGLNAAAGQGDNNVVYYGEHYLANEVDLAPNAVVLLHHLCYASGNSEPGHAEPTVAVARQRADNYAAGFIAAGAKAVIADGHMGPAYYLKALFTTNQTIDELWRAAPNVNGNTFGFASVRSPGNTVQMDPKTPTTGFLRSVAGQLGLRASQMAGTTPPPVPAASFTVPGNAAVAVEAAGVFADATLTPDPATGAAPLSLPRDTRVRLISAADTTAGAAVFQATTMDGSVSGFLRSADLVPGDSTPPSVGTVSTGTGAFSPNGDGRQDTLTVSAPLSETAWWRVRIWRDRTQLWAGSGTGRTVSATWSGLQNGVRVPDGTYSWTLDTRDDWGNTGLQRSGSLKVDTVAPQLTSVSLPATATQFSPNADGRNDTLPITAAMNEPGTVGLTIRDAAARSLRTINAAATTGPVSMTWDGRGSNGAVVPDAVYSARFAPVDRAGNVGPVVGRRVDVVAYLSHVRSSLARFYPQDNDRFAPSTTLSFRLSRAATVTWRVTKLDGTPVLTIRNAAATAAGTHTYVWKGVDQSGRAVPAGMYVSLVETNDGTFRVAQKTWVQADAFTIRTTDTTPVRGQRVEITTISSEPLKGAAVLHVSQPGVPTWAVRMTHVSGLTWKTTITFKPSSAGTVSLRVSALDADGRWQRTYMALPLQ